MKRRSQVPTICAYPGCPIQEDSLHRFAAGYCPNHHTQLIREAWDRKRKDWEARHAAHR